MFWLGCVRDYDCIFRVLCCSEVLMVVGKLIYSLFLFLLCGIVNLLLVWIVVYVVCDLLCLVILVL